MKYVVVKPEALGWVKTLADAERYYREQADIIYVSHNGKTLALSELPEDDRQWWVEGALRRFDEQSWLAYTVKDAERAETEAKRRGTIWGAIRGGGAANE